MAETKHWVVTGAGRGIGLALTMEILKVGDAVTALARNINDKKDLQRLLKEDPVRMRGFECDVTKEIDLDRVVKQLEGKPVDVLINNAGVYKDGGGAFEDLDAKILAETFETNVLGPFMAAQTFLPNLQKSKNPVVANITSQMGSVADNKSGGAYAYRISKAALNMFTKNLSYDLKNGIVLSVHPGWVKTDMGGAQAPTEKSESANGIVKLIRESTSKNSGHFYNFKGEELEW
jgi:NAD(P)-dependent dehydrogenase (short-subunit alcohol dehydrogenase family)